MNETIEGKPSDMATKINTLAISRKLTKKLTSKLSLIVMALTLLWVLLDASTRLSTKISDSSNKQIMNKFTALYLPQLSAQSISRLSEVYSAYSVKDVPKKNLDGMSAAEQLKQQGQLSTVFISDNKLTLKAVIKNEQVTRKNKNKQQQYYALIAVFNIKNGEQKLEKFYHNDDIYGYQLTIEKNTQVKLTKRNKTGLQDIRLTMYK